MIGRDLVDRLVAEAGSQAEVARRLGVSPAQVCNIRAGREGGLELLARWAEAWAEAGGTAYVIVVGDGDPQVRLAARVRSL